MKTYSFPTIFSFAFAIVLASTGSMAFGIERPKSSTPNIVMIMADDLGYETLGCYGGTSYETPNLDRLAHGGIRLNHCYAQPLCTPSRVKLMTGQYNVRNYTKFGRLPAGQITFANRLKELGYKTCITGKWQLEGGFEGPGKFGFDEYCLWQLTRRPERFPNPGLEINGKEVDFTNGEYGPDVCCNFACDFIEKNKDKPFLVYYPMILTHCPFGPTPDSKDWDPKNKGSKTYKGEPKYFGDMVTYMDSLVGRIEKKLINAGVRENTIIMFVGDNGTDQPVVSMMGDVEVAGGKGKMTDAGTRVPGIANWPGTIPAGQVSNVLVDFTDFLPTMMDVVGKGGQAVGQSETLDGRSLLPFFKGQPEQGISRDWIYVWYSRKGGVTGKQWARNQRYKLYPGGNFYDIQSDVLEKNPLQDSALSEEQVQVRSTLKSALDKFKNARSAEVAEIGEAASREAEAKKAAIKKRKEEKMQKQKQKSENKK